jgi:galactokinase/mevalonate kinase-like predicted kinase
MQIDDVSEKGTENKSGNQKEKVRMIWSKLHDEDLSSFATNIDFGWTNPKEGITCRWKM